MEKILTNRLAWYRESQRQDLNPNSLFRAMAMMAVAEEEDIWEISPSAPARIMTFNPDRDEQIYLGKTIFHGIDHKNKMVVFEIVETNGNTQEPGSELKLYCNGVLCSAIVREGGLVTAAGVYDKFAQAEMRGVLPPRGQIQGHLIAGDTIDMDLDWGSGMVKARTVERNRYRELGSRVKAGYGIDSYSQWKKINPTGMLVIRSSSTNSTDICVDTGIVCESTRSAHAPVMIKVSMADHNINLYLSICDIPDVCLPTYAIHPGQRVYSVSARSDNKGSYDEGGQVITLDEEAVDLEGEAYVIQRGKTGRVDYIFEEPDNSKVTVIGDIEWLVDGPIIFRQEQRDYHDGESFGGSTEPEDYYPPDRLKMCIIRGIIRVSETPNLVTDGSGYSHIRDVEYVYLDGYSPNIFPTYALSNYAVDVRSQPYSEYGDSNYDIIPGARYVGHYGRNPEYSFTHDLVTIGRSVSPIERRRSAVLSEGVGEKTSFGMIEFNIGAAIGKHTLDNVDITIDGYYNFRVVNPERPAIRNIMLRKVYVCPRANQYYGDIYSHDTSTGNTLFMAIGSGTVTELESDDTSATMTVTGLSGTFLVMVDNELMCALVEADGRLAILERGVMGTYPVYHASDSVITIMDRFFHKALAGYVISLEDSLIIAKAPMGIYASFPSQGFVMISGEIIGYELIDETDSKIRMSVQERGAMGSSWSPGSKIESGDPVYCAPYFMIDEIRPDQGASCEYNGPYVPRLSLPISYRNDPERYGALPAYILEVRYETYC